MSVNRVKIMENKITKEQLEQIFNFIVKTSPEVVSIDDVKKRIEICYSSILLNSDVTNC